MTLSNSAGSVISDPAQVTVVASPPRLELKMDAGVPTLTLEGVPGTPYRIEQIPDLNGSDWTPLVEVTLQTSPLTLVDSTAGSSSVRFYRIVVGWE